MLMESKEDMIYPILTLLLAMTFTFAIRVWRIRRTVKVRR